MAIYEKVDVNGIQIGQENDYCWRCNKVGEAMEFNLEGKEVFKLKLNGLSYCLCMKHFAEMLGNYTLIEKDTLNNNDVLEIPQELAENGTHEEVIAYIEKVLNK